MNDNEKLIQLSQSYIDHVRYDGLIAAFAGGSVGRGEADPYSDLDLNLYITEGAAYSKNIIFEDEIIQLHVHHVPTREMITQNPWNHRFLHEARIVYDPTGLFRNLQESTLHYFQTQEAELKMKEEAFSQIDQHLEWLKESKKHDDRITAGFAANAAWIDAAFAYAYFTNQSLGTGRLLPIMKEFDFYPEYRRIRFNNEQDPLALLESVKTYREFLYYEEGMNFELDLIQNQLLERKINRYHTNHDLDNCFFHLTEDAFWCYLSIADGMTIEQHIRQLPNQMKECLHKLGFIPYHNNQINTLIEQTKIIMSEVDKQVKEKWM